MLAVGTFLLVALVVALTPPKPDSAQSASGSLSAPTLSPFSAPLTTSLAPSPSLGPLAPPMVSSPTLAPIPQLPASFFAPPPNPEAEQLHQFEQLRYQVRLASIQMREQNARGVRRQQPTRALSMRPPFYFNAQAAQPSF
jgi:hypothetical protein